MDIDDPDPRHRLHDPVFLGYRMLGLQNTVGAGADLMTFNLSIIWFMQTFFAAIPNRWRKRPDRRLRRLAGVRLVTLPLAAPGLAAPPCSALFSWSDFFYALILFRPAR